MRNRSLVNILSTWEQLLAGAEANKEDLHALEPYRVQLEAEISDLKAAHGRRLALQAQAHQATLDLSSSFARGAELVERLKAGARLLYGPRSAKLSELGIKHQGRPRKARTKAGPTCEVKGCPLESTATAK